MGVWFWSKYIAPFIVSSRDFKQRPGLLRTVSRMYYCHNLIDSEGFFLHLPNHSGLPKASHRPFVAVTSRTFATAIAPSDVRTYPLQKCHTSSSFAHQTRRICRLLLNAIAIQSGCVALHCNCEISAPAS